MAQTTEKEVSGWVGWIYFAGMMMLVLGGLQALSGLVALFRDNWYVVTQAGLVTFNYTAWGWINIVMGLLLFAVGISLMSGRRWARITAGFLVVLAAINNIAFLPAYPWWSVIGLVINGLVLYALTVHGGDIQEG